MTIDTSRTPIENRVAGIFVHVTDLRRAAEWYSGLLGLPINEQRLGDGSGPVYWIELPGANLVLDNDAFNRRSPDWNERNVPHVQFPCRDIDEAYAHAQRKAEPVSPPHRHPGMAYFNFRAPDGQVFMACWEEHPLPEPAEILGASPVRARIGGAFVNVRDMKAAAAWIGDLLGVELSEADAGQTIRTVPTTKGPSLLLDDNRARNGEDFAIPFMFATDDVDAAFAYATERGMDVFRAVERFDDGPAFFTLRDPDGNLVMVCRE